nr:MAG TPA: major tail protein [Caudoviricetes sp.]
MVTNLSKQQIESIQIDESVIFLDYGETTERFLAPTRGGGEFAATVTVRDIEFDGRHGKTAGTQVIEEQGASIKVTTLCMSQENLALAIPSCVIVDDEGKTIKNPKTGVIPLSAYLKNVTMFAKLIGGKYKKIIIYNPMHETGFAVKAVQKAEGELGLELLAHYPHTDLDGDLWEVTEISEMPTTKAAEPASAPATPETEKTE